VQSWLVWPVNTIMRDGIFCWILSGWLQIYYTLLYTYGDQWKVTETDVFHRICTFPLHASLGDKKPSPPPLTVWRTELYSWVTVSSSVTLCLCTNIRTNGSTRIHGGGGGKKPVEIYTQSRNRETRWIIYFHKIIIHCHMYEWWINPVG
jgi:hypothetical protein